MYHCLKHAKRKLLDYQKDKFVEINILISINFKPFLDVIWHFFYDSNSAEILFMYHCLKNAKMKRLDYLKLKLEKSIFWTSINFKPFLDVIWHFFYESNTAAILFIYHCLKNAKRKGSDYLKAKFGEINILN